MCILRKNLRSFKWEREKNISCVLQRPLAQSHSFFLTYRLRVSSVNQKIYTLEEHNGSFKVFLCNYTRFNRHTIEWNKESLLDMHYSNIQSCYREVQLANQINFYLINYFFVFTLGKRFPYSLSFSIVLTATRLIFKMNFL